MPSLIPFTQITDKLPYPPKIKAKLSTVHAEIVNYVITHFHGSARYKSNVISLLNTVSVIVFSRDTIPINWSTADPFKNIEIIDDESAKNILGSLYIYDKYIMWDIQESETEEYIQHNPSNIEIKNVKKSDKPTPKEDLYIRPPTFIQFDVSKPWLSVKKDGEQYTIYTSLPIIPKNQRDISITTNIDLMTKSDLINLYPNRFIKTRAANMYEKINNLPFDENLGVILPINGFTYDQIRENIIKYPHFYKLKRKINNNFVSFYSNIEIDNSLHDTLEVWDSLPDSKLIPKTTEFIKEYVVRRYLLERDIYKIKHKYPIFGNIDPFLTLFTTPADYIQFGFSDTEYIAKQCVISRVNYLQTRNPVLRKVYDLP